MADTTDLMTDGVGCPKDGLSHHEVVLMAESNVGDPHWPFCHWANGHAGNSFS